MTRKTIKWHCLSTISGGLAMLAAAVISGDADAATGELDPAFGESGRVLFSPFSFGSTLDAADDLRVQGAVQLADGSLVVAGATSRSEQNRGFLSRFGTNGQIDFG